MINPRKHLRKIRIDGIDGEHYFHKLGLVSEKIMGDKVITIMKAFCETDAGRMMTIEPEVIQFIDIKQD